MSTVSDKDLTSNVGDAKVVDSSKKAQGISTEQARKQRNITFKRTPLKNQPLLEFPQKKGFHYRQVIDRGNKIERLLRAGYTFVEKLTGNIAGRSKDASNMGSYMNSIVGVDKEGNPQRAYIMCINQKWYDEDQKSKVVDVDRRMAAAHHIDGVPEKQAYGKVSVSDTLE